MKKKHSKGSPAEQTASEHNHTNSHEKNSQDEILASLNYPPSEDITRQAKKENMDVEYITRSGKYSDPATVQEESITPDNIVEDELKIVPGTDADVTSDDLRILESTDGMTPTSRLEELDQEKNEESDLDIPGADLDDKDEVVGEEDEENNYYSLGGDRHENLEEDPS
jgi:hypothetical protein